MKRTPLERKTRLRARRPPREPKPAREARDEEKRLWYAAAAASCQHPACADGSRVLAQHHVVYEQRVRRDGGPVYDPANALTVCADCHASHHRRGELVIPLSALSDANYAFAAGLLGSAAYDYLRRRYAGDDPRLDALLEPHYATEGP